VALVAARGVFPAFAQASLPPRESRAPRELVDCVNPMIGATTNLKVGEGKTFPGACTPFGLVQLSPDTLTAGETGAGYSYDHKTIEGFSFLHLSGVGGRGDLGNFLVTPSIGPLKTAAGNPGRDGGGRDGCDGYRSRFSHDSEVARAGYYAVTLDDCGVRAELTAAPRAGMIRFTFPENKCSRIQIDLARRIGGTSTRQFVRVAGERAIEGWMECGPEGSGWGEGKDRSNYTVYFYATFSRPLENFGVWSADIPESAGAGAGAARGRRRAEVTDDTFQAAAARAKVSPGLREARGGHLGFYAEFATRAGEQVVLKAGISLASIEGARANLAADIGERDFDTVRESARGLWRDALACVEIEGATDAQREAFATALYHAFIDPRCVTDAGAAAAGNAFGPRTVFSGWDVFRGEFPLLTLTRPDVVNDTINSLMRVAETRGGGILPRWEFMGADAGYMIGEPAISVIAEAWLKGIRGFDAQRAYALCRETATGPRSARKDFRFYNERGWTPGSISWTLENAYYDHCLARLAAALGKNDDAALFARRAQNYRNIYDPSVGNMRARAADGSWLPWRGPTAPRQGCVESNPWQQGWFVPHDVPGLVALMGGRARFVEYLNALFEKTPPELRWNDYYNHANEPVHHAPYLFACAGAPWLSQKWARFVMDGAYGPGVGGLCGNDDEGQTSAWYVLGALGFYPVSPVDGVYVIGSPLFARATLKPGGGNGAAGKTFTIVAKNNSAKNIYIQSATLNGVPLTRAWITHAEVLSGGVLEFVMGAEPNKNWGVEGVE